MKSKVFWWLNVPLLILVVGGGTLLWLWPGQEKAVATSVPTSQIVTESEGAARGAGDAQPSDTCRSGFATVLSAEPLLVGNGIVLSMGHAAGNSTVRFPLPCPELRTRAFSALTPLGIEALQGDAARPESTVPWGCGEDIPAVELIASQPIVNEDVPIVAGAAADQLQWFPAKAIAGVADCLVPQPGFVLERQQLFEITGQGTRWSLESWQRTLPQPLPPKAAARIVRIDVWSQLTDAGVCISRAQSQEDEDGVTTGNAPRLRGAYGVLLLHHSRESKTWWLFNSPGYEGAGVAAVPYDIDTAQLNLQQADVTVYSGC